MDFDQLQSFIVLTSEQHFGRAAQRLGVSKQVLSHRIITLEKAVRYPLFHRSRSGAQPTLAGLAFLKHARALFSIYQNAQKELNYIEHAQAGTIRIGSGSSFSHLIVPHLVHLLREESVPAVINIDCRLSSEMLAMLSQMELDCVACTPPQPAVANPDIRREFLFSSGDRVMHSANHPLAPRKVVKLADLVSYPWIVYPNYPAYFDKITNTFENAKLPVPREILYVNDPLLLKSLLKVEPYLAVWPVSALLPEIESRELFARDVAEFCLERPCYLFSHAKTPQSDILKFCVKKIRSLSRGAQYEINRVIKEADAWLARRA